MVTELDQAVSGARRRAGEAEQQAAAATRRADAAEHAATAAGVRITEAEDLAEHEATRRAAAEGVAEAAETEAEIARQDAERAGEAARAARAETERIRAARAREISKLQTVLDGIAPTRRTALGLVMNLGSDSINFDYDKVDLKPEDRELLARIIGVLLTTTGFHIQVFGHTDDVASQAYNQALSERRAQAVTDYLWLEGSTRKSSPPGGSASSSL